MQGVLNEGIEITHGFNFCLRFKFAFDYVEPADVVF